LDEWLLGFQKITVASSQGQAILQMLAATHPTQRHISEDLNPQQDRCKNLKSLRYLCAGIQKEVHMIQAMHYIAYFA
jgi:hypothetical protein